MSDITSWKDVIAAIEAFDDCDWEGEDLEPPTPTATVLAKRYAQEHASAGPCGYPPPNCINLTSGGGIAFWWRRVDVVACIEFDGGGGYSIAVSDSSGLIASLIVEAK